MERLYPMDFRAYECEKRELWLEVFEDELKQLHKAGFAHRDLRRPSDMPGLTFDNIFWLFDKLCGVNPRRQKHGV